MENDNLRAPEIDRVIHFLEYEINSKRSEATRPGWTTWAILGAMASFLWLMFSVLDTNESISWRIILYISLSLSISFDSLLLLIRFLSSLSSKQFAKGTRFEYVETSFGSFLILIFFRTVVLLIFLYLFSPQINNFVEFFCWLFLVFSLILTSLLLTLYYFQIPISTNPNPSYKSILNIFTILWLASGIIAAIGLIIEIHSKVFWPSISEWRLGFIILGLSLLVLIFSHSKPSPVLLLELDYIRRKLSLGEIDLNRAKQQIDLIIHGLKLNDVLQLQMNNVLVSLKNIQNIYEKCDSELRIIENFINTPSEKWNKEDKTTVDAVSRSLFERQNEIISAQQTLCKNKAKLDRRIVFFYGMSKDIAPDIKNLFVEIDKEDQKLNNIIEKYLDRINSVKDNLGKHDKKMVLQPNAQRHS
jgi:hypothetical protein